MSIPEQQMQEHMERGNAMYDLIQELESQLAEAKKVMQEISKLHDHEMSGIEIQQNAYDMACIARQFLSDAAIASIQEKSNG